jgi:hypothetical protein
MFRFTTGQNAPPTIMKGQTTLIRKLLRKFSYAELTFFGLMLLIVTSILIYDGVQTLHIMMQEELMSIGQ